jgi:serine/threonine-protein kinase
VDKSQADATKLIEDAGFTVKVQERPAFNARDGVVVAQNPSGGQALVGSTITITVSRGLPPSAPKPAPKPGLVLVPGVEGMDEREARSLLESQGFKVESRNEASPNHKGVVIRQNPEKDNSVQPGVTVRIFIGN